MTTSFTRIIVVLSFVRTAMGTQQTPPNQVLVGLALLLTFFVMNPVIHQINNNAVQPYLQKKISQSVALDRAAQPLRAFMFKQTREKDIQLFYSISKEPRPNAQKDVPTYLLVPAFVLSELKTAFEIGFAIYIPFIIVDMVTAAILLSMGMMMIPPIIISLPFKVLIFILVDGWDLVVGALFQSFHTVTFGDVVSIGQQAIFVALLCAAPVLLLSMVVGLVISLFQAITQIQEPTLAFIPKIVVSALAILFFAPFMLALLTDFAARMFSSLPTLAK